MQTNLSDLMNAPANLSNPNTHYDRYTNLRSYERPGIEALGFSVEKRPIYTADGSLVEDFWAVGRVGSPDVNYSIVGKVWRELQPIDVGSLAGEIARLTDGHIRSFSLRNGMRFGAVIELPGHLAIGTDKDKNIRCITLSVGNDGTAFVANGYDFRVICRNRWPAFLTNVHNGRKAKIRKVAQESTTTIRIRHTKSGAERMAEARQIVDTLVNSFERTEDEMAALAARRLERDELIAFFTQVLPNPVLPENPTADDRSDFERAMNKAVSVRGGWVNTAIKESQELSSPLSPWLAINAVTKWAQHDMRLNNDDDEKRALANLHDGRAYEETLRAVTIGREMFLTNP